MEQLVAIESLLGVDIDGDGKGAGAVWWVVGGYICGVWGMGEKYVCVEGGGGCMNLCCSHHVLWV